MGHVPAEPHTDRGKQKLVKGNALQGGHKCSSLGDGECPRQEAKPLVLDWRHQETVGHESCQSLEIKRRRQSLRVGDELALPGPFPVQVVNFDGDEVILVYPAGLASGALSDRRQRLCYRIRDAA